MDATQIRETLFTTIQADPEKHIQVQSVAAGLGATPGEVVSALDADLRFHRVPGNGVWDWAAYIIRTKPVRLIGRRPRIHAARA